MIADMLSNKKTLTNSNKTVHQRQENNISFAFITKIYFAVSNNTILNFTHNYFMKFQTYESFNKQQLIINQILNSKTFQSFTKN